jgi:protein-glutamine gamma-glutamyltransferase
VLPASSASGKVYASDAYDTAMKTPSLLLGAGLLFWGWQTGHLVEGAVMATVLEGAQWVKARWEFTDQDFRRIWTFCALLLFAAALYAFTSIGGPGDFRSFFQNPTPGTGRNMSNASARTIASLIRWLPMIFFLFLAAQAYSTHESIPSETISTIMRLRWQKARKSGQASPAARGVNVSYPYLMMCLFSASFHSSEGETFFWGLCALVAWALWPQRSRRFRVAAWVGVLALAVALGYVGQQGVGRLYRFLENYNPQWFVRRAGGGGDPTQSETRLGQIGWLKGSSKIVIRLEPKGGSRAPTLLREASYRTWKGHSWHSDLTEDSYEPVSEETNHTTWVLLSGNTNHATVNLACYLRGGQGLLPLPTDCGRLENLSAWTLRKTPLGAVVADGPGLVVFDALYGPGPTIDSPGNTNEDLAVPPREIPALDQVIAELQLWPPSRKQALRTVNAFFQDKFRYRTWQDLAILRSTNGTPLSRFLLRTRAGHCEYFATATVLLLRRLGIPARYAVGYAVHEASGQKYVVRQRDAHAWCLVWNPTSATWQDFDTTPASWVAAEVSRASPLQLLSDCWSRLVFEVSKFRWGQTQLRQYLLWGLVPVLGLLLYQIIFQSRRQRRLRKQDQPEVAGAWPGLDSEFYQVERKLASRGAPRQPGEPLSVWLGRAGDDPALAGLATRLRELLNLHYRYRFDPLGLSQNDREVLRRTADGCLAGIK